MFINGLILSPFYGNPELTFEQKKSAGIHHTRLRFGTYLYLLWRNLRYKTQASSEVLLLVHISEVPIRVAIEQINVSRRCGSYVYKFMVSASCRGLSAMYVSSNNHAIICQELNYDYSCSICSAVRPVTCAMTSFDKPNSFILQAICAVCLFAPFCSAVLITL